MRQLGEEVRRFEAALESERASRAAEVLHAYECQKERRMFSAQDELYQEPLSGDTIKAANTRVNARFSACFRYLQPDISAGVTPEEINPGSSETL